MAFGDRRAVTFVMVEGGARDYTIYRGSADMSVDDIASHGDKVYHSNADAIRDEMCSGTQPEAHLRWKELSFRR